MSDGKHRILVVGTGSIGERHVRCFLATGRADVGVCELDEDRLNTVADRYSLDERFCDVQHALEGTWDAVLVATPAHTHIPIAIQVVQSGTNVLIEKPLSTSLSRIDELQQLIADRNTIAAVSYQLRAHPGVRKMKAALDSGQFGTPLQLYLTTGQSFAYFRPAYLETYFTDHRTGGGAIQDAITHMLNLAEWLVGPVTKISVDAEHKKLPGVTVEDTVHILARHETVMASYAINMYQHPTEGQITVVCDKGTIRFEPNDSRLSTMTEINGQWKEHVHAFDGRDTWYIENADVFLDVLEGKCQPLCSLEDGIQTLRVNLSALKSAETHSWLEIP